MFERKVRDRKIVSASGRSTWRTVLEHHLVPALGAYYVDKITRDDIERLKAELLAPRASAKRKRNLVGGRYAVATVNKVLAILRQITAEASDEFNIADPCRRVADVSNRGHRTFTREAPNALKPADVPRFLDEVRTRWPEHYAFVFLGFTTGLRPSSLRPLRRKGPNADVKWDSAELIVRRSHTHRDEVMDETKTGRDQTIALDQRQLDVLRWHCDRLDRENEKRRKRYPLLAESMSASELPSAADQVEPRRWVPVDVGPVQDVRETRHVAQPRLRGDAEMHAADVPGPLPRRERRRHRDALDLGTRDRGHAAALFDGERGRATRRPRRGDRPGHRARQARCVICSALLRLRQALSCRSRAPSVSRRCWPARVPKRATSGSREP